MQSVTVRPAGLFERLGFSEAFDRAAPETRSKAVERIVLLTLVAGVMVRAVGAVPTATWWACAVGVEALLWTLTSPRWAGNRAVRLLRLFGSFLASCSWGAAGLLQWNTGNVSSQLGGVALVAGILLYSVRSCHRFPLLFIACAIPPIAALVTFAADFRGDTLSMMEVGAAFAVLGLFSCASCASAFRAHLSLEEASRQRDVEREAAQAAAARLQSVVDALPEGVVLLDEAGRYVGWNTRYAEIYRDSASQFAVGRSLMEVLRESVARGDYPDAVGREEAWLAERLDRLRNPGARHEQQLADGTWLLVEDRRLPDGGTVGVRIDITEMKRRNEQIAQATARREVVMNALEGGLARLSAGDLTCTIGDRFPAEYERLRVNFNTALDGLRGAFGDIAGLAREVGHSAGTISGAAENLSKRTERQAATLEETAAALNQVTEGVTQAAADAARVRTTAGEAFELSSRSEGVVDSAVKAMAAIRQASAQVAGCCEVIEGLAMQTRLLALNASIEASRAGDAGKGFAVIAHEVRALADSSAQAAKEIGDLAALSMRNVGEGAELVEEAGAAFRTIMDKVSRINTLVIEMSTGAADQALGLQQVNHAVLGMDEMTQENAAMVERTTHATQDLATEAARLTSALLRFRLGAEAEAEAKAARAA